MRLFHHMSGSGHLRKAQTEQISTALPRNGDHMRAMIRSLPLNLSAVALVAATDAAPAAPRGGPNQVRNLPLAQTQAKPRGQVRAQLMFTVGSINGGMRPRALRAGH